MLQTLNIANLAIVKSQTLTFATGLTVITGETGAGKSLILDGLGLIMGNRSDSSMVSHGAKRAEVVAEFNVETLPDAQAWLNQHELDDPDAPFQLNLRRTVSVDGRSKAYVNNRPVTLNDLRALSLNLIHLQGQHATYALLHHDKQRDLIDRFGQLSTAKNAVRVAYQTRQKLKKQLSELRSAVDQHQARRDLLEYQVQELSALDIQPNEWQSLADDLTRLGTSDDQRLTLMEAHSRLTSSENNPEHQLSTTVGSLTRLVDIRPDLNGALQLAQEALINIQELKDELQSALDHTDCDPERLAHLEQRMATWMDLARKHRIEPSALGDLEAELNQQLIQMNMDQSALPELEQQLEQADVALEKACLALTSQRQIAARRLVDGVNQLLEHLAMSDATLSAEFSTKEPSADGSDDCWLQLQSNAGQRAQPLSKIASGGELSRIALAIQVVVAEALKHQRSSSTKLMSALAARPPLKSVSCCANWRGIPKCLP